QAVPQSRAPASQQSGPRNPAANVTCFSCNQKGHYENNCPKKTGAAPRPNGGCGQGGGSSQDQKIAPVTQGVGSGRVNLVTAEEAQEAPDVVLGTLSVNSRPATILFDSGASHSFVSESFASASELLLAPLLVPLLIHSPGLEMRAELKCRDCAKRSICLSSPSGEQVRFSPKLLGSHLFALEAKPALDISEVPTVCDFVDVFPDELPGMPPVRDVEFTIELVPGTAPMSKSHYRMPRDDLVELKKCNIPILINED
ncbi:hypothetical protein JGD43_25615, partial [Salmonella enterica subsp. enterica serovar Goldcoast]|nr:hypothetical protein [Salmonella enterica subsp. enterica serovar Goldcoast]